MIEDGALLAFDIFHAEVLVKALTIFSAVFPALATVLLVYFLVTSFALVFMTDQLYHRWAARTLLGIFLVNIFVGGALGGFNFIPKDSKLSISKDGITKVLTYKSSGDNAQKSAQAAFGNAPFEAYAYLGDTENFAFDMSANLASGTEFKPTEYTLHALTRSQLRKSEKFGTSWDALNSQLTKTPMLSAVMLYVSNSMTSLAYSATKLADNETIGESISMAGLSDAFAKAGIDSSAWNWKDKATNDDLVFAAASGSPSSTTIYAPTLNSYSGGPASYASYISRRTSNPSLLHTSRTTSSKCITEDAEALRTGKQQASSCESSDTEAKQLYDAAVDEGYDADVSPDLYVRTHMDEYKAQCQADLDLSPGAKSYGSTGMLAALNPCRLTAQGSAGRHTQKVTSGLGGAAKDAYNTVFGSNSHLSALAGAVLTSNGLDVDVASPRKCEDIGSLKSLKTAFSKWERDSANIPAARSNKECIRTGKNITAALLAMQKLADGKASNYEDYIFSSSPWAMEDGGTAVFAMAIGDGDDDGNSGGGTSFGTAGAVKTENLADLSLALQQLLAPFAKDQGLPSSLDARQPTATVSTSGKHAQADDIRTANKAGIGAVAVTGGAAGLAAANSGSLAKGLAFIFKPLQTLFGSWLRLAQIVFAAIPAVALLIVYALNYFTGIFTTAFGLIFLPIWSVFLLGKLFTGPGSGDEQYGGVSLFPAVQFFLTLGIIGIELAAVGVAGGMTMRFFTHFGEILGKFVTAVTLTTATAVNPISDHVIGDPIGFVSSAFTPLGIILGVTMLPMFVHRLMAYQPYSPGTQTSQSGLNAMSGISSGVGGSLAAMLSAREHNKTSAPAPDGGQPAEKPSTFDKAATQGQQAGG